MKKLFVVAILTASLAACGGKKPAASTPTNAGGTEMKSDGATGGATYGTPATAPAPGGTEGGAAADPCAGK
jgi:predicted small lipoprotein YifL